MALRLGAKAPQKTIPLHAPEHWQAINNSDCVIWRLMPEILKAEMLISEATSIEIILSIRPPSDMTVISLSAYRSSDHFFSVLIERL